MFLFFFSRWLREREEETKYIERKDARYNMYPEQKEFMEGEVTLTEEDVYSVDLTLHHERIENKDDKKQEPLR